MLVGLCGRLDTLLDTFYYMTAENVRNTIFEDPELASWWSETKKAEDEKKRREEEEERRRVLQLEYDGHVKRMKVLEEILGINKEPL